MFTPPKQITIRAVRAFNVAGEIVKPDAVKSYDRAFAKELISNGKAVEVATPEPQVETKPDKPAAPAKEGKNAR